MTFKIFNQNTSHLYFDIPLSSMTPNLLSLSVDMLIEKSVSPALHITEQAKFHLSYFITVKYWDIQVYCIKTRRYSLLHVPTSSFCLWAVLFFCCILTLFSCVIYAIKLKNSTCDKTQILILWQNSNSDNSNSVKT